MIAVRNSSKVVRPIDNLHVVCMYLGRGQCGDSGLGLSLVSCSSS